MAGNSKDELDERLGLLKLAYLIVRSLKVVGLLALLLLRGSGPMA